MIDVAQTSADIKVNTTGTSIILLIDGCRFFIKKEQAQELRVSLSSAIQLVGTAYAMENIQNGIFAIGNVVTTDFYPQEKSVKRTITKIAACDNCQSGKMITTMSEHGLEMTVDAVWYRGIS